MKIPPQKLDEVVFLLLYTAILGFSNSESEKQADFKLIREQLKVSKTNLTTALKKANAILEKSLELDQVIIQMTLSYNFDRIQNVEKTALKIGIYDLLFNPSLPPKIAISEALRLTKKFSTPSAVAFVNAILDGVYKNKQGVKVDQEMIQLKIEDLTKSENLSFDVSN